jgi:hypothetical protein
MRRRSAPRAPLRPLGPILVASILVAVALLCAGLSIGFSPSPAAAQAPSELDPGADIFYYVQAQQMVADASGNGIERTATSITLDGRGNWVELRGPITISVSIDDRGRKTTETVKIEAGKTYTVGIKDQGSGSAQWKAIITLLSIDVSETTTTTAWGIGTSLGQVVQYINERVDTEAYADEQRLAAASEEKYREFLEGRGVANAQEVAAFIKALALMSNLRDRDTGQPIFPTLRTRGIVKIIALVAISEAMNGKKPTGAQMLAELLVGMDIANAAARVKP